jgi:hypothetical protein
MRPSLQQKIPLINRDYRKCPFSTLACRKIYLLFTGAWFSLVIFRNEAMRLVPPVPSGSHRIVPYESGGIHVGEQ